MMRDVNSMLDAYASEVLRFRKALNLTSIHDKQEFMNRFVLPSVALKQWLPSCGVMLDVGSGMGVPGIPLLLAMPDMKGVLVERRKKRAEFLRHLVRLFDLQADVHDADINALPHCHANVCVARAVSDVKSLLEMFSRHVDVGALAVLPVPRATAKAGVAGWEWVEDSTVEAVEIQKVQCYRYGGLGGFT